jgi:surface antigen
VVRARTITPVIAACAVAAALHVSVARAGVIAFGYPYATSCPAAGIAERVDRWKMYVCNCTSYVAWALSANGQTTSWFIPGSMDARNWAHVAELKGIPVGRTPRVGSVAVWPRLTPLGHVAYVTGVDPGGRFDVGEYNLPVLGAEDSFAFDLRRGVARSGVLFVYVPRRRR